MAEETLNVRIQAVDLLSPAMKEAGKSIDDVAQRLGYLRRTGEGLQTMKPQVETFAKSVTTMRESVNAAGASFNAMDGHALKAVSSIAKVGKSAIAIEGMMYSMGGAGDKVFGSMAGGIGKVAMAFRALGVVMDKGIGVWGLLAAGVVAAGMALYQFMQKSDGLEEKLNAQAEAAKKAAEEFEKYKATFKETAVAGATGGEDAQRDLWMKEKKEELEKQASILEEMKFAKLQGKRMGPANLVPNADDIRREQARFDLLAAEYTRIKEEAEQAKKVVAALKELNGENEKADREWNKLADKAAAAADADRIRSSLAITPEMAESIGKAAEGLDDKHARTIGELRNDRQDEIDAEKAAQEQIRYVLDQNAKDAAADYNERKRLQDRFVKDQQRAAEMSLRYWQAAAAEMSHAWQDAFGDVVFAGKDFGSAFKDLAKNIGSMFFQEIMKGTTNQLGALSAGILGTSTGQVSGSQGSVLSALGGSVAGGVGGMGIALAGVGRGPAANMVQAGGEDVDAGDYMISTGGGMFAGEGAGESGSYAGTGLFNFGTIPGAEASIGIGSLAGMAMGTMGVYQAAKGSGGIAGGAIAGMTAGATIGSIIPGIGTVIGGVIGAIGGAIAGAFGSRRKKRAARRRRRAQQAAVAKKAKSVMQAAAGGGLMERGAMEEIGSLLAGGLTYKEAMKFFGSEDALNQTAAKMSGTNSVTNNTSVQAPITVNATINSEMDIDVVAHRLGEKLSSTVAASIPRV
jgi:hypothetical protein